MSAVIAPSPVVAILGLGLRATLGPRVVSPVAVDLPVGDRPRRRSALGPGESGDRAVESAPAITGPGLLFEHPGSRDYDPRGQIAEHPDTPERIDAIDGALAAVDWLGWERRSRRWRPATN